jgi:hypothetical protein
VTSGIFVRTRGFLAVIVVALLALLIFARKPYLEIEEVRASTQPQTLQVTSAMGCEESYYVAADGRRYIPYVPDGGKELEQDFQVFITGNNFVLTGYPYKTVLRNVFTGAVVEERSERFDVLAWSIIVPYKTQGENGEDLEGSKPLNWKSIDPAPTFAARADRPHSSGC